MRLLLAAWGGVPVARLARRAASPRYELSYAAGASAVNFKFPWDATAAGAPRLGDALPPPFSSRLMRPSRPDWDEYLRRLGVDPADHDEFDVLGLDGRSVTNALEFLLPPRLSSDGRLSWTFFARGVDDGVAAGLAPGDELRVEVSESKVLVVDRGRPLGEVPLYLGGDARGFALPGAEPRVAVEAVHLRGPAWHRARLRLESAVGNPFKVFHAHHAEALP